MNRPPLTLSRFIWQRLDYNTVTEGALQTYGTIPQFLALTPTRSSKSVREFQIWVDCREWWRQLLDIAHARTVLGSPWRTHYKPLLTEVVHEDCKIHPVYLNVIEDARVKHIYEGAWVLQIWICFTDLLRITLRHHTLRAKRPASQRKVLMYPFAPFPIILEVAVKVSQCL